MVHTFTRQTAADTAVSLDFRDTKPVVFVDDIMNTPDNLNILVRQKAGSELSWVTVTNDVDVPFC